MEYGLKLALDKATKSFAENMWFESFEYQAFSTNPYCLLAESTALLSTFTPGYKFCLKDTGDGYLKVILFYNSVPLMIASHPALSVNEADQIYSLFFQAIKLEILKNEMELGPVTGRIKEIQVRSPRRKRDSNRHLSSDNIIGALNERVLRSKSRRL
jgi:hypothetical protein